MHLITCPHAKKHDRLWKNQKLVDKNGASWLGPYDTYDDGRIKANKLSFTIWDCTLCRPHHKRKNIRCKL